MPSKKGEAYIRMSAPCWPAWLLPMFQEAPETMTREMVKVDQTGRPAVRATA